jgi:hypothetical protein
LPVNVALEKQERKGSMERKEGKREEREGVREKREKRERGREKRGKEGKGEGRSMHYLENKRLFFGNRRGGWKMLSDKHSDLGVVTSLRESVGTSCT